MRHGFFRKIIAIAAILTAVSLLPACMGTESFVQTVTLNGDLRGLRHCAGGPLVRVQ